MRTQLTNCVARLFAGDLSAFGGPATETADQLEYLRQISCDEVQGYLIGRPVSADGVQTLLNSKKLRSIFAA